VEEGGRLCIKAKPKTLIRKFIKLGDKTWAKSLNGKPRVDKFSYRMIDGNEEATRR